MVNTYVNHLIYQVLFIKPRKYGFVPVYTPAGEKSYRVIVHNFEYVKNIVRSIIF